MDSDLSNNLNFHNPLDVLEEIINIKQWQCSRANDDELIAEIESRNCIYRLYFVWSQQIKAVSLTITFDLKIPESMRGPIYEILSLINENLWMGHFDVTSKTGIPAYRNTVLIRKKNLENIKIIEDLVDIGINECERFYPSFQMVLWDCYSPKKAVSICLMETKGRA